jgi:hypothetical protein
VSGKNNDLLHAFLFAAITTLAVGQAETVREKKADTPVAVVKVAAGFSLFSLLPLLGSFVAGAKNQKALENCGPLKDSINARFYLHGGKLDFLSVSAAREVEAHAIRLGWHQARRHIWHGVNVGLMATTALSLAISVILFIIGVAVT